MRGSIFLLTSVLSCNLCDLHVYKGLYGARMTIILSIMNNRLSPSTCVRNLSRGLVT